MGVLSHHLCCAYRRGMSVHLLVDCVSVLLSHYCFILSGIRWQQMALSLKSHSLHSPPAFAKMASFLLNCLWRIWQFHLRDILALLKSIRGWHLLRYSFITVQSMSLTAGKSHGFEAIYTLTNSILLFPQKYSLCMVYCLLISEFWVFSHLTCLKEEHPLKRMFIGLALRTSVDQIRMQWSSVQDKTEGL
jgi:hypothetical protein